MPNCSTVDCSQLARSKTAALCDMHYKRNWRYGSVHAVRPNQKTPWERFWVKVDASGDCWEWTASTRGAGYGQFGWAPDRIIDAHRVVWELLVGPIPEGLTIDHLCRNKICVNPDHLEVVTYQENINRSPVSPSRRRYCPQGHPLFGDNLRVVSGARRCINCDRRRSREQYWKRKEDANAS